jgi:hypothetical protein
MDTQDRMAGPRKYCGLKTACQALYGGIGHLIYRKRMLPSCAGSRFQVKKKPVAEKALQP